MEGNVQVLFNVLIKMRLMHRYYCDCNFKTNDRSKMLAHIRNHSPLLKIDHATAKIM